ncbi:MAG: regulatory protein RecX [Lachnospirales bacterium]
MGINDIALKFLHYRMRTEIEMKDYLEKKGFDEKEISDEIDNLKALFYIDDVRYTSAYIRYGLSKRKALYRIQLELRNKGVRSTDIQEGIYKFENEIDRSIYEIEIENAIIEMKKIIGMEMNKKKRDKLARRLNALGYSASTITSILEKGRYIYKNE